VTALAIKVLLADDGKIIRPAIARLLKEEPSVELVGEATSFGKTIKLAAALKPDILLKDLHMHECEYPPRISTHRVIYFVKVKIGV
jgi:DNA-binding NarL/FixJ family response regulator